MKYSIYLLLFVLISCKNPDSSDGFVIKGEMIGDYKGKVFLYTGDGEKALDSTDLKGTSFIFKGKVQKPTLASIYGEGISASNRNFYIENKEISVEVSSKIKEMEKFLINWFDVDSVWGTTTAKVESQIFHSLEGGDIPFKEVEEILKKYKEHPLSGYLLSELVNREMFSKDTILKLLSRLDQEVISAQDLTRIFLYTQAPVQKRDVFIDFSLPDFEGGEMSTREIREANFLFIDFWASWCAPCREQIPELLAVEKQFKDKQIRFLAVSLDKKKESWKKAIHKDNLNWTNLVDTLAFDGAVARNYHITAIPYNLLVSPKGIILEMSLTPN